MNVFHVSEVTKKERKEVPALKYITIYYAKCFAYMISLNTPNNFMRWMLLLSPLFRLRN